MIKKILKLLQNKKIHFVIILVILISCSKLSFVPAVFKKLLKSFVVRTSMLVYILYLGRLSIKMAVVVAVAYILMTEKLNDEEVEKFTSRV
jgi:hypothetical protein